MSKLSKKVLIIKDLSYILILVYPSEEDNDGSESLQPSYGKRK